MQASEPNHLINFVLNHVLPVYKPASIKEIEIVKSMGRGKEIYETVMDFNPAIHVIITKEEFDLKNDLKALVGMASTLQDVKEDVQFVKSAYTKQPDGKIKKSVVSDVEKSIARKAKLLKIPKVR